MVRNTASWLLVCLLTSSALAGDWSRFRGPNGSGVSPDSTPTPVTWSETENLKWKTDLPGKGRSSPIIVGNRVFVTCWSGGEEDPKTLKRHLVCVDRETGKINWTSDVEPFLPEDAYRGMFMENGYTSHTPVSDGERVYVFFGKTGALAFDMDGKQLWQTSVGTESDPRGWGSGSSPILYKNLLIVTASAESEALVGLDKKTGKEVWRQEAQGFNGTWGTPVLVEVGESRVDLVLAVPYEVWGFNPDTGKLRWYCDGIEASSICSSVVAHDGIVYAVESGREGGGAVAVRVGGKGDVSKSNVVWSTRDRGRIGTPVFFEDRLFWVSSKTANCLDAKTGDKVYQSRLSGGSSTSGRQANAGGAGRRRFGGGGGQDYSSPVVADGKMYYSTRGGDTYVVALGEKFEQLAKNRFDSDDGDFSATPAITDGQIFIRSSNTLYCVANMK